MQLNIKSYKLTLNKMEGEQQAVYEQYPTYKEINGVSISS